MPPVTERIRKYVAENLHQFLKEALQIRLTCLLLFNTNNELSGESTGSKSLRILSCKNVQNSCSTTLVSKLKSTLTNRTTGQWCYFQGNIFYSNTEQYKGSMAVSAFVVWMLLFAILMGSICCYNVKMILVQFSQINQTNPCVQK